MCGRFTQRYTWNEVHTFLNVFGTPLNLRPRYNIAPTTTVDVVRLVLKAGVRWSRCDGASCPCGGRKP